MREIKFRAWDKEKSDSPYSGVMLYLDIGNKHAQVSRLHVALLSDYMREDWGVLMQYTGLKDSKGVEIYEGDLIQYGKTTYEVRWNFVRWIMFDPEFAGCDGFGMPLVGPSFSRNKMKDIEIIGNIYEHPPPDRGKE